jgi:hypothetical protein
LVGPTSDKSAKTQWGLHRFLFLSALSLSLFRSSLLHTYNLPASLPANQQPSVGPSFVTPLFLFVCDLSTANNVCRGSVGLCANAAVRYQSLHVGNQIHRCLSPFVSGIQVRWHYGPTGMWHYSILAVVLLLCVRHAVFGMQLHRSYFLPLLTCSPLECVCRQWNRR